MKKGVVIAGLIFFVTTGFGQKGFPKYYEYVALAAKGDSLLRMKDYKNAGLNFLAAGKIQVERGIELIPNNAFYNAACAFALANQRNDALNCLEHLASELECIDYETILAESDFVGLHKEPRWLMVLSKIKTNKIRYDKVAEAIRTRTEFAGSDQAEIFYPYSKYAKSFIENDSLPFLSVNYNGFRLFFTGNSYASGHLAELKDELMMALARSLSILNATSYKRGIYIILVDTPEELQELTGIYARGGMASIGHDLVFFVYNNDRRGQFKHELFHLISNQQWGITYSRLLNEGGAVYADNQCWYDNPLYSIAAAMLKTQRVVPFESLINHFDQIARVSDVIAYLQSAAIFKFLFENYGPEKIKMLWIEGFDRFDKIYGMSIQEFENRWTHFIETVPIPENIDWQNILNNGC